MSSSSSSSNCYSSAHTSSHLRGLMVQSTSPSSASSSSSTIPSTLPQFTSSDLNVINNSASNSNQVHPIFAISPASGITYSWISPPKSLPRKRTVFSRSQRIELEKKFQAQVRCRFFFFLLLFFTLTFTVGNFLFPSSVTSSLQRSLSKVTLIIGYFVTSFYDCMINMQHSFDLSYTIL